MTGILIGGLSCMLLSALASVVPLRCDSRGIGCLLCLGGAFLIGDVLAEQMSAAHVWVVVASFATSLVTYERCNRAHKIRYSVLFNLVTDAFHNAQDGLILMASQRSAHASSMLMSILLHELAQELSDAALMRQAGWSSKKILISNTICSSTVFFPFLTLKLLGWNEASVWSSGSLNAILSGCLLHMAIFLLLVPGRNLILAGRRRSFREIQFFASVAAGCFILNLASSHHTH